MDFPTSLKCYSRQVSFSLGKLKGRPSKIALLEISAVKSHSLAPESGKFSLEQVPSLDRKVTVVTCGSEGIGYGRTHTFLNHNISKLFILSESEDVISDALSAIRSEMSDAAAMKAEWMQCDLSD